MFPPRDVTLGPHEPVAEESRTASRHEEASPWRAPTRPRHIECDAPAPGRESDTAWRAWRGATSPEQPD